MAIIMDGLSQSDYGNYKILESWNKEVEFI